MKHWAQPWMHWGGIKMGVDHMGPPMHGRVLVSTWAEGPTVVYWTMIFLNEWLTLLLRTTRWTPSPFSLQEFIHYWGTLLILITTNQIGFYIKILSTLLITISL